MRIALKFAYDGRSFYGYARQPKLKTIEDEILKIFIKNDLIKDANSSLFRSASRTDKGVSALGNVIAFNTNYFNEITLNELSRESEDIIFYGYKKVESDFYPRHALMRHYRYYLETDDMDIKEITKSIPIFTGEHNFSNFARVETLKNPIRKIDKIDYLEKKSYLIIDFYAQTFLWHQIRRIISALMKIGNQQIEKEKIIYALKNPNIIVDFGLASSKPLILKDVKYDFEFQIGAHLSEKATSLENKIISTLKK